MFKSLEITWKYKYMYHISVLPTFMEEVMYQSGYRGILFTDTSHYSLIHDRFATCYSIFLTQWTPIGNY